MDVFMPPGLGITKGKQKGLHTVWKMAIFLYEMEPFDIG